MWFYGHIYNHLNVILMSYVLVHIEFILLLLLLSVIYKTIIKIAICRMPEKNLALGALHRLSDLILILIL